MSKAWRQQAIPLIATEIVMSSILFHNQASELERVCSRVNRWATQCWAPLKKTHADQKALQRRMDEIHKLLDHEFSVNGVDVTALGNMLLYLIESTSDQVPEDRQRAWRWLAVAVGDFSLLVDPDRDNDEAIDRGLNLGQQIQNIVQ